MGAHHIGGEYGTGETNRRLVRLFCICLGTLFFAYFILTFRIWLERGTFGALDLFLISVRLLLSGMVLLVVVDPPWLARRLDRQIDLMGSLFEQAFANSSTKEKIRSIVLVTMLSLLLELVHDPLARLGLSGVRLLQELHHAGLLPRPRRRLRGCRKAALRARRWCCRCWRCSSASSRLLRYDYRRRPPDHSRSAGSRRSTCRSTSCSGRVSFCAPASAIRSASSAASCCTAPIR